MSVGFSTWDCRSQSWQQILSNGSK